MPHRLSPRLIWSSKGQPVLPQQSKEELFILLTKLRITDSIQQRIYKNIQKSKLNCSLSYKYGIFGIQYSLETVSSTKGDINQLTKPSQTQSPRPYRNQIGNFAKYIMLTKIALINIMGLSGRITDSMNKVIIDPCYRVNSLIIQNATVNRSCS